MHAVSAKGHEMQVIYSQLAAMSAAWEQDRLALKSAMLYITKLEHRLDKAEKVVEAGRRRKNHPAKDSKGCNLEKNP